MPPYLEADRLRPGVKAVRPPHHPLCILALFRNILLSAVLLHGVAKAAPGDLDPTFGSGGVAVSDFSVPEDARFDSATAMVLQDDGKILVAGSSDNAMALARSSAEGSPDATFGTGGIEVAEVFAYTCIHCANLQPTINTWKPTLASDVRFRYVPGAFGGPSDNFARGFFAAETMGLLDKTHDGVFKAFFVERKFQTGSLEEIADHYASAGADREAFLSTMNSFAVTAKVNRARQFALRTTVDATPTMIINGKYKATTTDRGPEGLLATIEYLVALELANAAQP